MDAVILTVAHQSFMSLTEKEIASMFKDGPRVLIDIKGILDRKTYEQAGYLYWRF